MDVMKYDAADKEIEVIKVQPSVLCSLAIEAQVFAKL
jgi:hypothetical protein